MDTEDHRKPPTVTALRGTHDFAAVGARTTTARAGCRTQCIQSNRGRLPACIGDSGRSPVPGPARWEADDPATGQRGKRPDEPLVPPHGSIISLGPTAAALDALSCRGAAHLPMPCCGVRASRAADGSAASYLPRPCVAALEEGAHRFRRAGRNGAGAALLAVGGAVEYRFNPPPSWPVPLPGWAPPPGWQPDPAGRHRRRAGGCGFRSAPSRPGPR